MRHGETLASRGRSLAGWEDVPLTEHGEAQAAALRPVLAGERFDGVWCSDLRRAARHRPAGLRRADRPDRRLREMSFGALEGVHWEALEARWQQALARFEGFEPPGGETFEDLRARVLAFVDSLPPGRHLLFTHGGVVRLLSREVGEDQFVSNATVLVIDWEARRLRVAPRRRAGSRRRRLAAGRGGSMKRREFVGCGALAGVAGLTGPAAGRGGGAGTGVRGAGLRARGGDGRRAAEGDGRGAADAPAGSPRRTSRASPRWTGRGPSCAA